MKAFGHVLPKPSQIWTSLPTADRLRKIWSTMRQGWGVAKGRRDEAFQPDVKITPGKVPHEAIRRVHEDKLENDQ